MATEHHDDEKAAQDELAVYFYEELRRQARNLMRGNENHTLQPTALVNEAYLKFAKNHAAVWNSRSQFLQVASTTLRHVLVDYFRRKNATTRPLSTTDLELDQIAAAFNDNAIDLIALDDVLEELGQTNPYGATIIDLRFFGGASNQEIAEIVDVPLRTAQRDLRLTKDWIHTRLVRT